MKKIFQIILIINTFAWCLFASGCVHRIKIPIGSKPTEKFTVTEYVKDDAVFQASSTLKIEGKSNPGVVMVAALYNYKNSLVSEVYGNTDNDGFWRLSLATPDASMKEYTLKIYDSTEIYHETYTNIKFGEVWMIMGDELENVDFPIQEEVPVDTSLLPANGQLDYSFMFYLNEEWVPAQREISHFGYQLIRQIESTFNSWNRRPISVVFATSQDSNIYQWLSREIIDSRKVIKDYLVSKNLYTNSQVLEEDDMSYLSERYLTKLQGMSYANIVIHQGLADLIDANNNINYDINTFQNVYSQMLYTMLSEIENSFLVENRIFYLQEGTNQVANAAILRLIQSNTCNYYNRFEIVPTYDLAVVYDSVNDKYLEAYEIDSENLANLQILGLDYMKVCRRLYQFSINAHHAPMLNNAVKEYDSTDAQVRIRLVFTNVNSFDKYDIIQGLKFYDIEGEEVEVKYTFEHNQIIIDLLAVETDQVSILDDTISSPSEELTYIKLSKICYAQDSFIYGNNLSANQIGVIPFEIILN